MTQTTVIGHYPEKERTPIVFRSLLDTNYLCKLTSDNPGVYEHIELICLNYAQDSDLMFAYHGDRSGGTLYIGKWNDGVVK